MIQPDLWSQERLEEAGVSRETREKLHTLVSLLLRWQDTHNLIAPSTIKDVWRRHIVDSVQLSAVADVPVTHWLDLGSGGGFPGLVIALLRSKTVGFRMTLVEANAKKSAFLRTAARELGLPVSIVNRRIEDSATHVDRPVDVVSARALAGLETLLAWSAPWLIEGAIGVFPKGQGVDTELTAARQSWNFDLTLVPSVTESAGQVVKIVGLSRRSAIP